VTKPHRLAALVILAATVAACGAPREFAISEGQTIRASVPGKTVVGQLGDGTAYCEYHDPNGTLIGRDFEIYAGNWEVRGNAMCYAYPGAVEDCQYALIDGTRVRFMDGFGNMVSQGNLIDGNVCN
jgi:hypothetical protein